MSEELIKSLKEQLEMVIKENQRLLEKHFEQDSKIVYLNADYNRYKEENKKLNSIIKEVREYIEENYPTSTINYQDDKYKLLEILDKVEESK